MDTIYALASARGKAGVAVVRVSGPLSFVAATRLAGELPAPRVAGLRMLRDLSNMPLDQALVLAFPENNSFTGQAVVEFHLHGSMAAVGAVLRTLSELDGLRQAEPGEFTRRAMENGRLDLAQVEGLADLIDAETEAQRRQALRVFSGAIGKRCDAWRTDLIRAAALLEATIDFADEDVPIDVSPEVLSLVDKIAASLRKEISASHAAERIRDGFEVAIVGPPNVGKSTLLNALAGRDAAITSEIAGTTRDVIEVQMDLAGLPVTVLDTAGLRHSDDIVESIGIERAISRANQADLRVFLTDSNDSEIQVSPRGDDIVVMAKADLHPNTINAVSGLTGAGLDQLIDTIGKKLESQAMNAGLAIRERHRVAMSEANRSLELARIEVMNGQERAEFAAEEIRTAIRALDSMVGRIDVEHVLDEIFASFCLGK